MHFHTISLISHMWEELISRWNRARGSELCLQDGFSEAGIISRNNHTENRPVLCGHLSYHISYPHRWAGVLTGNICIPVPIWTHCLVYLCVWNASLPKQRCTALESRVEWDQSGSRTQSYRTGTLWLPFTPVGSHLAAFTPQHFFLPSPFSCLPLPSYTHSRSASISVHHIILSARPHLLSACLLCQSSSVVYHYISPLRAERLMKSHHAFCPAACLKVLRAKLLVTFHGIFLSGLHISLLLTPVILFSRAFDIKEKNLCERLVFTH